MYTYNSLIRQSTVSLFFYMQEYFVHIDTAQIILTTKSVKY